MIKYIQVIISTFLLSNLVFGQEIDHFPTDLMQKSKVKNIVAKKKDQENPKLYKHFDEELTKFGQTSILTYYTPDSNHSSTLINYYDNKHQLLIKSVEEDGSAYEISKTIYNYNKKHEKTDALLYYKGVYNGKIVYTYKKKRQSKKLGYLANGELDYWIEFEYKKKRLYQATGYNKDSTLGRIFENVYDKSGKLVKWYSKINEEKSHETREFFYDEAGNHVGTKIYNAYGLNYETYFYKYDESGKLIKEGKKDIRNKPVYYIEYEYTYF